MCIENGVKYPLELRQIPYAHLALIRGAACAYGMLHEVYRYAVKQTLELYTFRPSGVQFFRVSFF